LTPVDTQTQLPAALSDLGLALSSRACERLLSHLNLIAKWNRVYNLTALRDPAEMWTHHLLDSLAAVQPLARHALQRPAPPRPEGVQGVQDVQGTRCAPTGPAGLHVLDVGSGAGLPGVTLAIALPEVLALASAEVLPAAGAGRPGALPPAVRVSCVDAVAKKAGFIRQVAAELGLSQLQALHGRIESLKMAPADVITCRAFASLADIVRLTRVHLAPGGVWMALKGAVPTDEMAALPTDIEVFHVEPLQVPHLNAQRCLVWMRPRPQP